MTEHEFASLRAWVKARYRESGLSPEVLDALTRHNDQVLGFTEQIADGESVSPEERTLLIAVAVLHDCAKAETPLLLHAQAGAERAAAKLRELGKEEGFIATVERAILSHMGPLAFVAEEVRKYAERTGEQLHIPQPDTRIEKLFYDADMLTLMDVQGIEKIVILRSTTPEFVAEDTRLAEERGTTPKDCAYASALQSVHRAADTLYTDTGRRVAAELVAKAERYVADKLSAPPRSAAG